MQNVVQTEIALRNHSGDVRSNTNFQSSATANSCLTQLWDRSARSLLLLITANGQIGYVSVPQ